jgi:hypothetical protein
MGTERVVVQLTITVDCDGKPSVTVDTPCGGTPGAGTGPVGSPGTSPGTGTATCVAQRTVHIVAGTGGLAWFTLIWPAPDVITAYIPNFAYDNPANAGLAPAAGADHPLFVRKIGTRIVGQGLGKHDLTTVFVAGANQTHTASPDLTTLAGGPEVIAAGAAVQLGLAAPVPVIALKEGLRFGPAPGAPSAVVVATVEGAIGAIGSVTPLSPALEQSLRPAPATLASWGINAATPGTVVALANNLLFAANAFRLGLVSTVLMPAFNDDPHGAWAGGDTFAAARADALARILDGFFAELAQHTEPKANPDGKPLSLADNVVLVVSGDTPKNPFNRDGWSDGTPGGSNLVYVRANGYLKPGWFGRISVNGRTNFDPTTGLLNATTPVPASSAAMQLAILFAIARGNAGIVSAASTAPYAGVVANPT